MKFIGFWGKGKEAGEPVLEYHPPYEEDEEQEMVMEKRRKTASWDEEDFEEFSEEES